MKTALRMFLIVATIVASVTQGFGQGQIPQQGKLINMSVRGNVTAADPVIVGFVASSPKIVLIRAVGPTLGTFGVPGVNTDPKLDVFEGDRLLATNDDWGVLGSSEFTLADKIFITSGVGAFPLAAGSFDATVLVTIRGATTVLVKGSRGELGAVLVEVYDIPDSLLSGLSIAKANNSPEYRLAREQEIKSLWSAAALQKLATSSSSLRRG